jgi:acetolactate synthase-1/2/3 large subunit
MLACEFLIKYLEMMGVKYIFGVSGANIEDTFNAIITQKSTIKPILAKHEYSAASMAAGYGRIKHDLGVVMTTSGGGALNTVSALAECMGFQQPLLAILGMPPMSQQGYGAFQNSSGLSGSLDGDKLFSTLASNYFHSFNSIVDFEHHIKLAIAKALTSPFGTAILLIPKDIQTAVLPHPDFSPVTIKTTSRGDLNFLPDVIEKCKEAQGKVLIVIGEGVRLGDARAEAEKLNKKMQALIAVTAEGKSYYNVENPNFVGVCGAAGHESVIKAAKKVSMIIFIGTRMQIISRAGFDPLLNKKSILYINTVPPAYDLSKVTSKFVIKLGNIKKLLRTLIMQLRNKPIAHPLQGGVIYTKSSFFGKSANPEFNFQNIFHLFNQYIKNNHIISADAGNTGDAALHYLKPAAYFDIALVMGNMGFSIGASIGSYYKTKKIGWCFLGDGALLMQGMEIHTAIEHNLPIRFIVFNNNAHGMCYTRDKVYLSGKNTFNIFKKSHYGKGFAIMFPGFYSYDIDTLEELKNHLEQLQYYNKPALLSLDVDYKEIPPFAPFLQAWRALHHER